MTWNPFLDKKEKPCTVDPDRFWALLLVRDAVRDWDSRDEMSEHPCECNDCDKLRDAIAHLNKIEHYK